VQAILRYNNSKANTLTACKSLIPSVPGG
jgi:hypothetical protein